jgi:crotonobetainyl-CoA:carnitine CoA-transferase CaiB-like acyl-CoA transferase
MTMPVTDPVRFLDDVGVLEIASLSPTQLGMHLADLGADVIKIEPPGRGEPHLPDRDPAEPDDVSALPLRAERASKSMPWLGMSR